MNFPRFRGKPEGTALASNRIPDIPFSALPREISRKLRAAAARIRRILFLRGLFAVLATALIAILVSMAVDYMVTFTGHTVRWILWAIGVGAVALVARQTLVKPLGQKFTPARLAALLERNHPELQERLSTVVELLSMPDAVGEGSELLLDVVKSAAESDVRGLSPSREFSIRTVKPRFFLTAAAVLVLTVLFLVWPDDVGRLFARAVVPAAEIDNVWADNLRVSPGKDEYVLEGQPYTIHLAVVGGFPGKAYVRCRPIDRSTGETSERMAESAASEEDGTGVRHYSHTVASVDKSFSYYVVCGSAVTRAYSVVALPAPAFAKPTVTLAYPAYTGAAPKTLDEGALDISAVAGTRVTIRIEPNGTRDRPVHSRLVFADGRFLAAEETDGSPVSWEFPVSSDNAGPFEIQLFDDNGFSNAPAAHAVSVLKDETPTIEFVSPTNLAFTLPAHGTVPIAYTLKDDFGVSAPMLQAKVDSGAWRDLRLLEAAPSGAVAPVRSGSDEIRLAALPAPPRAGAQFRLRARDNLPPSLGGPHDAFSAPIVVRLDGAAQTLGSKRVQQAGEKAKAKTDSLEKNLRDAMELTREARREQLANRPEKAAEKLAEAKEAIAKAEDKAHEMVREMKDGDMAALAKDAKDLLEETLKPAHEKADEAIAAKPEERVEKIDKLLEKLDGAADAAKDLQEKRKELEKELKAAQEMTELADKQEMLAKELGKKEMTEEEKKAWEEKQKALLDELKKKQDEMSADPLAEQRKQAEDLAKRYAALARKQQALENTAAALGLDPAAAEPRAALAKSTAELDPSSPLDSERFVAAQEPLAREAEELSREVGALVRSLPPRAFDGPANVVTDARREANTARDRSRDAAEEARLRVQDEKNPPKEEAAPDSPDGEAPSSPDEDDDEFAGGLDDLLTADDLAALAGAAGPRKDMDEEMKRAAAAEERAAQLLAAASKAIDDLSKQMGEENMEAAKRAQEAMEAAQEALKNEEDPLAKQREKAQELSNRFDDLAKRQEALREEQKKGATEKLAEEQRELAREAAELRNEVDDLVRTLPQKTEAAATLQGARSDSEEARREADGAADEARLRAEEKDGPKKEEPPPAPTQTDDFFGDEDEFGGGLDDLLTAEDLEAISHANEPVRRDLDKSMERAADALQRGKDKMDQAAKDIDDLSKKLASGEMQDPSQMDPSQMDPSNMDPSQMQNQQGQMDPSQMQPMDPSQMQPMDPSQMQQMEGDPNAQRDWNGDRDPNAETQNAEGDPNAQREWDGNRDPTAEVPIGDWDPNAEHAPWDGQKDPNAQDEQKDGQWDPNAKREPWDGNVDPNAQQQQQQGQQQQQQQGQQQQQQGQQQQQQQGQQQQQQQGQQQQQQGQQQQQQQGQQQQQQGQQQQQQGQQQPQNAQQQAQQQAQNAAQQMQQMAQQMQQQAGSQQQQQQQNGPQQQGQQQQQQQNGQQQNQQNQQNQPQNQQQQQNSQQQGPHQEHKPIDPNSIGDYNPLRNMGVSDNDWLRVQNGGGSEALDAAVENVPPEYRELVREYFQALANEK